MNKKVDFVQSVFGITLPNFELYTSSIEVEEIQKEEGGITYPPKWQQKDGTLLPQEFEVYLPKESMTPEQAIKQLSVCSSLGFGWRNDSYKLYGQEIMMQFIKTAVINCIYLASKDFTAWTKEGEDDKNYLSEIVREMNIFNDGFSRQRPSSYYYEEQMRFRYLKLLLENDFALNKGTNMGNNGDIFYNTLYENLFSNFIQGHRGSNEYLTRSISRMLQKKCYEVVEELQKIK